MSLDRNNPSVPKPPSEAHREAAEAAGKVFRKGFVFAGRYEIQRLLGTGTLGAVYLATDLLEKNPVVVKIFYRDRMTADGVQKRFQRFMKMAQDLRHPNFVSIIRFGEDALGFFVVREYVDGQALDHLILERKKAKKNFRLEEVFNIFSEVARALSSVEQQTFHGGLSPSNILITEDRVVISDLGVPRVFQPAQFSSLQIYHGNGYYYLAPEYDKAGAKIDQRADLYSAAVMAYEMLTGEIPRSPVIPPSVVNPDVPLGLDGPFLRALQLDSEERQNDLQQLIDQLRSLAGMVETGMAPEVFEDSGLHAFPPAAAPLTPPTVELSSDFLPVLFREETPKRVVAKDIPAEVKTPNFSSDVHPANVKKASAVRGGIPTFPRQALNPGEQQKMPALPTASRPSVLPPMDWIEQQERSKKRRRWLALALCVIALAGLGLLWKHQQKEVLVATDIDSATPQPASEKPAAPEAPGAEKAAEAVAVAPLVKAAPQVETFVPKSPEILPSETEGGVRSQAPETTKTQAVAKKPKEEPCPKDMVFVPAGTFNFGSDANDRDFLELAVKKVALSGFCIDRYEWPNIKGQRVLTKVSFSVAANMCSQEGKRLCTETEWERSCKGSAMASFPYGENFSDQFCQTKGAGATGAPARVGGMPRCKSSFGAFDMSGNVAEWTAGKLMPGKTDRMARGGSFRSSDWAAKCTSRKNFLPETHRDDLGFRCCKEPNQDSDENLAGGR